MIAPTPFKIVCPKCGWSRTYAPGNKTYTPQKYHADLCLGLGDRKCPKCGCGDLKKEPLDQSSKILNFIKNMF